MPSRSLEIHTNGYKPKACVIKLLNNTYFGNGGDNYAKIHQNI